MAEAKGVRWVWLKVMYIWTIVIGGAFGLLMVLAPDTAHAMFNDPCDPATYGMLGSAFMAFGLVSVLGLRAPLRFVPVLFFQLIYKAIWFIGVVLPLGITGKLTADIMFSVVIFGLTIVGDLIAIPFAYIWAKQPIARTSTSAAPG
jgi:hypothetical protein